MPPSRRASAMSRAARPVRAPSAVPSPQTSRFPAISTATESPTPDEEVPMDRLGLSAVALVASVTALTATARAQSTVDAEKLFRDGKGLMKQRKVAEACDAFEASQRIESNISTLMSLADCREKNGQLASAWGHFLRAESMTRSDPSKSAVNTIARRRAAAIEPRMSYLIVNVPD